MLSESRKKILDRRKGDLDDTELLGLKAQIINKYEDMEVSRKAH